MHLLAICKEKELTIDLAEDHPNAEDQIQLFNRSRRDDTTKVFSLSALQYKVTEQCAIQLGPVQDVAITILQNFLTALKHDNTPNNRVQVIQAIKELKEIFQKYDRGVFGLNLKTLLNVAIGINLGYLNEALNMVKYNYTTVSITFAGPLDPIYVWYDDSKFPGIPTHIALIMPMRI
jgi:hypothetical protein